MTSPLVFLRQPATAGGPLPRAARGSTVAGPPATAAPRWTRPALAAVLLLAAVLFLWDVTRDGTSNDYYAAAVKSGSESWKAWFFGSLDPGSFITVDKPPLALWLMGLSARVFGFSSASMLVPEGLASLGAVALLHATVRRAFGPAAGIAAALALAVTPVTVAIARVNNPDALLVFLLVASAYLVVRAIASGHTRPLVAAGAVVGLAFMTKMLQGWMVVPALGGAYLLAGPAPVRRRLAQLTGAGAAMVAVSAAWPTAVSLWPGSAPYIGGSTDGSAWNLIFGYNGFGRLTGDESGTGGGGGSPTFGGSAGLGRLFDEQVGGQVAWLLPLAAVGLVAGLWLTRRAPRTDLRRAVVVLLGLWAIVHVAVFSTQEGIFHPYYTSALAPAVAGLAAIGVVSLWTAARRSWIAGAALAAGVLGTAWLAVELLRRTSDYAPWLRGAVVAASVVAVLAGLAARLGRGRLRRLAAVAAVAGVLAVLAGPAAYSVANLGRSLDGNNVIAGPASASAGGFGGGGGGFGGGGTRGGPPSAGSTGAPPTGATEGGASGGTSGATQGAPSAGRPSGGGMGGGAVDSTLVDYLTAHQGSAEYLVAASGAQTTAGIILQTGKAVVTIGGFSGSDPTPTVSQLAKLVADGKLKYVLVGGGGGRGGGSSALTTWVQAHGKAVSGLSTTAGTLYEVSA